MRWTLALLTLLAVPATAAELREPRRLAVAPQPNGACGSGAAAGLVLRDSLRPDVGPYAVRLSGYGQGGDAAADRYAPYLVRLDGGGSLRLALRNALSDQAANLHTHGLFTAPRFAPPCDLGDYSQFSAAPLERIDYRITLPRTLPAAAVGRAGGAVPYPAGMAWFHAHVHGLARDQVATGMAGLISVGDPLAAVPAPLRSATDVRHLLLRDIQLAVPDCPATGRLQDGRRCPAGEAMLPGPALADGAAWPAAFGGAQGDDPRWDPALCGDFSRESPSAASEEGVIGPGFCARARGDGRQAVWLFTVNGQWMPTVTAQPGRHTLLRIANLSASVTYVLELAAEGAPPESLRVLALDGALAGSPAEDGWGVTANRLPLPPGARAEVLLPNSAGTRAAKTLTLRTAGFAAGTPGVVEDGNPVGDVWPGVALATVVMRAQAAPPPALPRATPTPLASAPARGALPASAPADCILLPPDTATRQWRRVITLDKRTTEDGAEEFLMGSAVVDQDGAPLEASMIAPIPYPAEHSAAPGHALPEGRRPCPVVGRGEVWEVVNAQPEFHNLHLHQGRFRLARAGDPGAPPGLTPDQAMTDPAGVMAGLHAVAAATTLVWHDSLPVAPRAVDGTPGRTFLYLPFAAPEQAGDMPIHCHVLEHEDKGMMAMIRVLPAASTAAALPDRTLLALLALPDATLPAACVAP